MKRKDLQAGQWYTELARDDEMLLMATTGVQRKFSHQKYFWDAGFNEDGSCSGAFAVNIEAEVEPCFPPGWFATAWGTVRELRIVTTEGEPFLDAGKDPQAARNLAEKLTRFADIMEGK